MKGTSLPLLQQTNADVYLVLITMMLILILILGVIVLQLAPVLFKKTKSKAD